MNPHKHADLIKAWADGAVIQFRSQTNRVWNDVMHNAPSWESSTEYRVKPVTIKYMRYLRRTNGAEYVVWCLTGSTCYDPESFSDFVRWIDQDWIEEVV